MVDEIAKAQTAVAEDVTLFDKIVQKKIPATIIYEDDLVSSKNIPTFEETSYSQNFNDFRHSHSVTSTPLLPCTSWSFPRTARVSHSCARQAPLSRLS